MKSFVTSISVAVLLLCLTYRMGSTAPLQFNSCQCPEPPGGSVNCPKGLIPVCIIRKGKLITSCAQIAAFTGAKTVEEKTSILLSGLLRRHITPEDLSKDQLLARIQQEGGFRAGDVSFSFRISGTEPDKPLVADLPRLSDERAVAAANTFAEAREKGFAIVDFDEDVDEDPFISWKPSEATAPTPTPRPASTP